MEKLRIGIVSSWWNRGQSTVSRYLRSVFDSLGHHTFVLARPTSDTDDLPNFISTADVWNQRDVTRASRFFIPLEEYLSWVEKNAIRIIFFDENNEYDKIKYLRSHGIKTFGRFVWEGFGEKHAKGLKAILRTRDINAFYRYARECFTNKDVIGAKEAFDIVYSLTKCEQARYKDFGIDSPWIQWGCHPELLAVKPQKRADAIYFFFPGGFQGARKPMRKTVEAFMKVKNPDIRLIIKAQGARTTTENIDDFSDARLIKIVKDLPAKEYYDLFSSCHVCLAPSRWEGLGQHFYEAISFGLPTITNNIPPHNEVIEDGKNGLLVKSVKIGYKQSGISIYDPDVDDLARAIEELSNVNKITELSNNTIQLQKKYSWNTTTEHIKKTFGL
ncbi:glycosyltransferase family 4 protein [Candidatus Kuenenia sp.]|uniref:glycosyltransferase family 4 protein n=1 Tax=Candidatus Kuenenia sp. TaxID=2499824 RepID=UPI00321FE0D2